MYDFFGLQLIICNTKDFKCLLAGDKAALDSQALLGHLLSALVAKLLHSSLITLLMKVLKHFLSPLLGSERSYIVQLLLFLVTVCSCLVALFLDHVTVGLARILPGKWGSGGKSTFLIIISTCNQIGRTLLIYLYQFGRAFLLAGYVISRT